ncbi:MAG TPA: 30S ribosome-binding factor RbfA [Candidatus Limnocylindrales bacterium]|jgi:ribosome-binding factor A|nr:30S ribosome-binding factor RbfA [Candidatus Limnocylindrales bacterium]
MTQRTERIDELLRQEIGEIVSREISDPRVGFATITNVETAPDLRHARVWVSVIGQESDRRATLAALGRAMPFVRHELGKRLRLKRIPEFHLELDDTLERGTRVLHLLDELGSGKVPEGEPPAGETLPTPVARLPHEGDVAEVRDESVDPPDPRPSGGARRRTFRPPKNRTVPGRRRR